MKVLNEYLNMEDIKGIRELFLKKGKVREYKKNAFFVRQGDLDQTAGFIIEGAFRYLGYTSEEREQIVGYSFKDDFVVDYASFQNRTPSVIDAQAVNDSKVLVLTYKDLNDYYATYDCINLRSRLAEVFLADIYNRLLSLYCDSPEERYQKLLDHYPNMLNQVSLKEIASFVKVTPETLSRIRRKVTRTHNP